MYYDLVASLPPLPHFTQADHSPITRLRLDQRLGRLQPEHARQLNRVRSLVSWRGERLLGPTDADVVAAYRATMDSNLESPLREYVMFRMEQQTLVAALRWKHAGRVPEEATSWGGGRRISFIRRHWDQADFGLAHLYTWLPRARAFIEAGDARGLEGELMNVAWSWLNRCAERTMFGFAAVFSYVFQWDMLQLWLACDADQARKQFTQMVDQVTHVEPS